MRVKIREIGHQPVLPTYQTFGAAGADVCANENGIIEPRQHKVVSTGLSLEIPLGYECQVRPRSGLAAKHGVTVLNTPGTIDSDYRGEVKVILYNSSEDPFPYQKGDRIAQLVFAPVTQAEFDVVDELTDTERGEGGFGSTGRS